MEGLQSRSQAGGFLQFKQKEKNLTVIVFSITKKLKMKHLKLQRLCVTFKMEVKLIKKRRHNTKGNVPFITKTK